MNIRLLVCGAMAALGLSLAAPVAAEASSTPWEVLGQGGRAGSCAKVRGGDVCAVVVCQKRRGDLRLFVQGLPAPAEGVSTVPGSINIDNNIRDVTWAFNVARNGKPRWFVDVKRDQFFDRVQKGYAMVVQVGETPLPVLYSLAGSFRAIEEVDRNCPDR